MFDEKGTHGYNTLVCQPEGRAERELLITGMEVCSEIFMRVKDVLILVHYDCVPFKNLSALWPGRKN